MTPNEALKAVLAGRTLDEAEAAGGRLFGFVPDSAEIGNVDIVREGNRKDLLAFESCYGFVVNG